MYFSKYKETNILYSGRKQFQLRLTNLDSGLQIKLKLSTQMDLSRTAAKSSRMLKLKTEVIREKNRSNTKNFRTNGKQKFGMV